MAPPASTGQVSKRKRQMIRSRESGLFASDDEQQTKAAPPNKKVKGHLKKKKQKAFPFLSLPEKIRNKIYSLALTHHTTIHLNSRNRLRGRDTYQPTTEQLQLLRQKKGRDRSLGVPIPTPLITRASLTPAILSLNHRVYAEAQPHLYAENTFTLEDAKALHDFLGNIGVKNSATIKTLTLKHWGGLAAYTIMDFAAFTLLARATGLERLYLDARVLFADSVYSAQLFYGNAYVWLWAVGGVKGDMGKVREVLRLGGENMTLYGEGTVEESIEEFEEELERLLKT